MKISRLILNLLLLLLSFNTFSGGWVKLTFSKTNIKPHVVNSMTDSIVEIVKKDVSVRHEADTKETEKIEKYSIEPPTETSSKALAEQNDSRDAESQGEETTELQDNQNISFSIDGLELFVKKSDIPHFGYHLSNLDDDRMFRILPTDDKAYESSDTDIVLKYRALNVSLVATRAFFKKLAGLVLNKQ